MSKKEKSKKDKKKGGKKSKLDKAKLKAPSKKATKQEAIDLAVIRAATAWWVDPTDPQSISDLRAAVERLTLASRPASRGDEPTQVDFSTVIVTSAFRERVYRRHDSTPRETNHMNKAPNCVMRAANAWGMRTGGIDPNHAFCKTQYWETPDHTTTVIDLATFVAVAESVELQREVSKLMGRSSFMGPVGTTALKTFVVIAEQVVRDDARAASSS